MYIRYTETVKLTEHVERDIHIYIVCSDKMRIQLGDVSKTLRSR